MLRVKLDVDGVLSYCGFGSIQLWSIGLLRRIAGVIEATLHILLQVHGECAPPCKTQRCTHWFMLLNVS